MLEINILSCNFRKTDLANGYLPILSRFADLPFSVCGMNDLICWNCDYPLQGDWLVCPRCAEIKVRTVGTHIRGQNADAKFHRASAAAVWLVIWVMGAGFVIAALTALPLQPLLRSSQQFLAGLTYDGFEFGFWVGGAISLALLCLAWVFQGTRQAKHVQRQIQFKFPDQP
jgi:hypothetical protein